MFTQVAAPFLLCLMQRAPTAGIHSRKMNLLRGINLKSVAEKMPSASGAECKVCVSHLPIALRISLCSVFTASIPFLISQIL